jgi:hypothetical protein
MQNNLTTHASDRLSARTASHTRGGGFCRSRDGIYQVIRPPRRKYLWSRVRPSGAVVVIVSYPFREFTDPSGFSFRFDKDVPGFAK